MRETFGLTEQRVLEIMHSVPEITTARLAEDLGISGNAVGHALRRLRSRGLVIWEKSGPITFWRIQRRKVG